MMLDQLYLLSIGFLVGLSGALIPGPLLVYTISQSVREGKWTGIRVILGHALVELLILAAILLGVSRYMTSDLFVSLVSLAGGGFLILMAVKLYRTPWEITGDAGKAGNSVAGGFLFTALNPSFPLWWATVGARLVIEGYRMAGRLGAGLVVAGHWLADFGWYILVSVMVHKSRKTILKGSKLETLRKALSIFLLALGAYFIATGL